MLTMRCNNKALCHGAITLSCSKRGNCPFLLKAAHFLLPLQIDVCLMQKKFFFPLQCVMREMESRQTHAYRYLGFILLNFNLELGYYYFRREPWPSAAQQTDLFKISWAITSNTRQTSRFRHNTGHHYPLMTYGWLPNFFHFLLVLKYFSIQRIVI